MPQRQVVLVLWSFCHETTILKLNDCQSREEKPPNKQSAFPFHAHLQYHHNGRGLGTNFSNGLATVAKYYFTNSKLREQSFSANYLIGNIKISKSRWLLPPPPPSDAHDTRAFRFFQISTSHMKLHSARGIETAICFGERLKR